MQRERFAPTRQPHDTQDAGGTARDEQTTRRRRGPSHATHRPAVAIVPSAHDVDLASRRKWRGDDTQSTWSKFVGSYHVQVLQWRLSFAPPRRPGASGPWRTPRSLWRARISSC
eukprot:2916450-Prymnesium_polylepis.1